METIEAVEQYANNKEKSPFKSKLREVKQLSGGLANYVYRLTFEDNSTSILKYFAPHLSSNTSFSITQDRYFVEKAALGLFSSKNWLESNPESRVRTPKLIHYDDDLYTIIMEDAGENVQTLFNLLIKDSKFDSDFINLVSKEIRIFSDYLSTKSNITPETHQVFNHESGWKLFMDYMTYLFKEQAKKLNIEKELEPYKLKSDKLLSNNYDFDPVFSFGDLWPNSILIDLDKKLIWIVDWEMARFRTKTSDLEQFIGNLWVMKQNPKLFDTEKIDYLIKQLQFEFFGDANLDWRKASDSDPKTNFIIWVICLLNEKHWEIEDSREAALKAIKEAEDLI